MLNRCPDGVRREDYIACVDHAIRERQTWKVLATEPLSNLREPHATEVIRHQALVRSAIDAAGWAPFHYDRRQDDIAEPWRFYWLDHKNCRRLAASLPEMATAMKPGNKIPLMLAACSSLVVATWLPEEEISDAQKQREVNEEHLAAASAAVQNLLLALTARGCGTYWSSGGSLRDLPVRKHLGIPMHERFLAAVFIDDPTLRGGVPVEMIPGKNREKRTPAEKWCHEIQLEANDSRIGDS